MCASADRIIKKNRIVFLIICAVIAWFTIILCFWKVSFESDENLSDDVIFSLLANRFSEQSPQITGERQLKPLEVIPDSREINEQQLKSVTRKYAIYFSGTNPRLSNGDHRAFGYGFIEITNGTLQKHVNELSENMDSLQDVFPKICWEFSFVGCPGIASVSLEGPLHGSGELSIFSKDCITLVFERDLQNSETGRYSSCISIYSNEYIQRQQQQRQQEQHTGDISVKFNQEQGKNEERQSEYPINQEPLHGKFNSHRRDTCGAYSSPENMQWLANDIFSDPSRYYIIVRTLSRYSGAIMALIGGEWTPS